MNESFESAKVLLSTYKDHASIVNGLWNIFQIVALAIIGLIYKEEQFRQNVRLLLLVSVGFLAFAHGNRKAIMRSQDVIFSAASELRHLGADHTIHKSLRSVLCAHRAPSSEDLTKGHWVFTTTVIAAIWAPWIITIARRKVVKAAE